MRTYAVHIVIYIAALKFEMLKAPALEVPGIQMTGREFLKNRLELHETRSTCKISLRSITITRRGEIRHESLGNKIRRMCQ